MKRLQEITGLWNWLPAFRAVAEMEKVTAAAVALGTSPSALSRSVRLLEEALGRELFDRDGRRMILNDAGVELLDSVRESMRRIHSTKERISHRNFFGHVWLSGCPTLLSQFALPAFREIRESHPDLVPSTRYLQEKEITPGLRQGITDVAIMTGPIEESDLAVHELAKLHCHVYASPLHDCGKQNNFVYSESCNRAFARIVPDENGFPKDGWPCESERRITMVGECLQNIADMCSQGDVLAFLPDVVARSRGLTQLKGGPSGNISVYVLHRPTVGPPGRAEAVTEAILHSFRAVDTTPRRR